HLLEVLELEDQGRRIKRQVTQPQNRLTEDDMCMASPALVGNKLVIRTSEGLYCIQGSK
ncbi:MAG: hypothetical protein RJA02_2157, partial [Armatimonadota bacterium]